jgi:hypothetical protein
LRVAGSRSGTASYRPIGLKPQEAHHMLVKKYVNA